MSCSNKHELDMQGTREAESQEKSSATVKYKYEGGNPRANQRPSRLLSPERR
jgi:hypothetical protein